MRKILLSTLLGFLAFCITLRPQPAGGHTERNFHITRVAEGVYAAIATPDGVATGNSGFIIGDEGVLVVDTFFAPSAAAELISEIERRTTQPIRYVVNTHYHLDHTGGNQVFAARQIPIIAHEHVPAWQATKNQPFVASAAELRQRQAELNERLTTLGEGQTAERQQLEKRLRQTEAFLSLRLTQPTLTFKAETLRLYLGKREVVLSTLPGHTGGDTLVYVPDANVMLTGDLGWSKTLPNLADARLKDWIPTLDRILSQHSTAQFIPGHGPVSTAAELAHFRAYLVELRHSVARAIAGGLTLEQAQATIPLPEKYRHFALPQFAARNVEDVYEELTETPRP